MEIRKLLMKKATWVVITWSRFGGMKFQLVQPKQISRYDYMGKSIFISA